jgi:excisionase family DNA binding protein
MSTDTNRGQDARRNHVSDDRKLLTYQQIAQMFSVTTRTVKRWRAEGRLKPIRLGRVVRFRPSDVDAMIKRSGG